jgi:hypothetical protein
MLCLGVPAATTQTHGLHFVLFSTFLFFQTPALAACAFLVLGGGWCLLIRTDTEGQ